jgi:hypothetical protein
VTAERRQSPRVQVNGKLLCEIPGPTHLIVRDLSFGGMLVEAPRSTAPGAVHECRVGCTEGTWRALVWVRVLACTPVPGARAFHWHCAFERPDHPATVTVVSRMLDEVTSVLDLR